ncbi:MAG: F0F1 ATP synthase subunit delta [Gammaproteobacteria bacterium]|jgi:F-type H+-transporting ATPase subunit delta|nr:F0F1 ATP synthase subunit delta [Gammaproteobacteria bacterium]MBT6880173.1 F0F1 ATP synthase subunit delta [Gammaproteobacteria bacterium]
MEERTTVARPYAEAAYQQARKEAQLDEWSAATEMLAAIVQDPAVAERLDHPHVSREQMADLVLSVGGAVFSGTRENFIHVLLEAKRLGYAPEIFDHFHTLRAEDENVIDVEVLSAYPLNEAEERSIADAVSKKMGKEVLMTTVVDASLFGGVIVRAGDQVIDLSLRGKMNQLSNLLHS